GSCRLPRAVVVVVWLSWMLERCWLRVLVVALLDGPAGVVCRDRCGLRWPGRGLGVLVGRGSGGRRCGWLLWCAAVLRVLLDDVAVLFAWSLVVASVVGRPGAVVACLAICFAVVELLGCSSAAGRCWWCGLWLPGLPGCGAGLRYGPGRECCPRAAGGPAPPPPGVPPAIRRPDTSTAPAHAGMT